MIIDRDSLKTGEWQLVEPAVLGEGVRFADLTPEDHATMLERERRRLEKGNFHLLGELAIGPAVQALPHELVDREFEVIGFYQRAPQLAQPEKPVKKSKWQEFRRGLIRS